MSEEKFRLPLILFDDKCAMCIRFKQALCRIPGHETVNMPSLYDEDIYQHFDFLDAKACREKIHLIDENRQVHVGGEAVLYLISKFPQVQKFSWLLDNEIAKKASEIFYSAVNTYRNKVQKSCNSCSED